MKKLSRFSLNFSSIKHKSVLWGILGLLLIILMANLGAIIDLILHPEIEYFDSEHIIVGSATAIVIGTALIFLIKYILQLENAIRLNKETQSILRQKEDTYKNLFENSGTSICIVDRNGVYLMANEKASEQFGLAVNEIIGKSLYDLLPPQVAQKSFENNLKLIDSGGSREYEDSFTLNGKQKIFLIIDRCIKDLNGVNYAIQCSSIDITARILAENELAKYRNHLEELVKTRTNELDKVNNWLRREIEKQNEYELLLHRSLEKEKELNKMKSRFISTTSHEFRTPLTAILSSSELLQRYNGSWELQKKNEHFDRIRGMVEYLTKLLDDILLISRSETGNTSFQPKPVNLQKIIEDCISESTPLKKENHNIFLNYSTQEKLYKLDETLIKSIFSNLLSNAIKFSPEGGQINVLVYEKDDQLIAEVSDHGIGLECTELDKIFLSFYRGSNVGSISGTGLGLAIINQAVVLHGGKVYVKSRLNEGTVVVVNLPIKL
ncbi:MAG: PAS domain-containing sensor histidine kinase [Melioribacteraceae bacterium]